MPLFEPKFGGGFCAKATIKGVVVTFHLTPTGQKRLSDAGVQPDKKFPLALLADLARQGHAWTPPSIADKTDIAFAQQFDLNLAGDEAAERMFTACTDCASYDDLHLVAWQSAKRSRVAILCAGCRVALAERCALSVPLPLVSLESLSQLEAQGKLPAQSQLLLALRRSLANDLSAEWERFRQSENQRQRALRLELPGELKLG